MLNYLTTWLIIPKLCGQSVLMAISISVPISTVFTLIFGHGNYLPYFS